MKTGRSLNIINKCVILTSLFVCSIMPSFASSYLSGIDVAQQTSGDYKVMLKLDKKVQVKKSIDAEGNLSLILNSTLPSESIDIVYDNATDLKNVTVQKKNGDNTLILIQAPNIENAKVYTRELSTGLVNEINNTNFINNLFFIADKKILASAVAGVFLLFLLMLVSRPKETIYTVNNAKKHTRVKKQTNINTLRNKNLVQSQNVPSINYKVNGRFIAQNQHMSRPTDFVINNYIEEKVRKVG